VLDLSVITVISVLAICFLRESDPYTIFLDILAGSLFRKIIGAVLWFPNEDEPA
jgi:hypothetical protein